MMLCQNRPEGLSTTSQISSPLPTQCFFDTVLVPLPTWLYLALLALLPLAIHTALPARPPPPTRRWQRTTLQAAYYFSTGVVVLMESVEVGRLAAAALGVALTPFVYVGCLLAVALQATRGVRGARWLRGWQLAGTVFWTASLCVTAVKTAALARLEKDGPFWRVDSAYPVDHQITDLVVLLVFYGLLIALELACMLVRPGWRAGEGSYGGAMELK